YTDDLNRPGQAHAVILRSPHAHARVLSIDTAAARAMPGVIAVFTGADLSGIGGLPCGWAVKNKDGSPMAEPPHPVLAVGKVRHVGDPVAVAIAETRAQAQDAAEAIAVSYEVLPAAGTIDGALAAGAAQIHDAAPGHVCYDWHIGDAGVTDAAFAAAHKVVVFETTNNRLIPNAMEPRAAIGDFDPSTGEHTLYTTSQNPHVIRLLMGAFVLSIPESKLRVVAPDVGGGFGSKIYHYAEEALVTWAAAQLKRPVKWTADRSESFMSDAHGRDHVTRAELALDREGTFLGLKVSTRCNMGAYLSTFAPAGPTYRYATLLAGTYRTPTIYAEVKAVFTNTVPVDAYRGAGRPEATFLLERLVDVAAREMGMD
ncbi:MAG: xanthine dehydrogenase family protein molybdopterin-binding subunit, partial [Acetobacteraceae bacterium]